MTIDEIMEKWVLGETDLEKARVLLRVEKRRLSSLVFENEWINDPEANMGNPYELDSNYQEYMLCSETYYESKRQLKQLETFLEELESMPDKKVSGQVQGLSPIVWNATQADLARIYEKLFNDKIIDITGREFSRHFLDKKGQPMPEDFLESKGHSQPEFSKKQSILSIQKMPFSEDSGA